MARGRKPTYADWITEEGLATITAWRREGLTEKEVAENIGIAPTTLCDWKNRLPELAKVLKNSKDLATAKVINTLFEAATKGFETVEEIQEIRNGQKNIKRIIKQVPPSIPAMIFYLKNRAGWRDNPPEENDNKDNTIQVTLDWNRDA